MKELEAEKGVAQRRKFLKQCTIGCCAAALGTYTAWDMLRGGSPGLRVGWRNDAPEELWKWSKEAEWYETSALSGDAAVQCTLCPHNCVLGENDRGYCRSRVVKNGKLYSLVFGNPCSTHIDPIEKKPLNHFLPGSAISSIATAGCNLRCLNCQNWEISQYRPEETRNYDLMPERLVELTSRKGIPSLAYTYSEPIIFYEYVYQTAVLARQEGIRNVLVTAGYISPKPLRKLCQVVDAANVDLKAFNEAFYKRVCGATLKPVLRALEIMREEGVWLEVTRLIVSTLSDDFEDMRKMFSWMVKYLGADTPLHLSRFYPAHKLRGLPATSVQTLVDAKKLAEDQGLKFVYIGNVPGYQGQDTSCPKCGEIAIARQGYRILENNLIEGKCFCGEAIPGIWS